MDKTAPKYYRATVEITDPVFNVRGLIKADSMEGRPEYAINDAEEQAIDAIYDYIRTRLVVELEDVSVFITEPKVLLNAYDTDPCYMKPFVGIVREYCDFVGIEVPKEILAVENKLWADDFYELHIIQKWILEQDQFMGPDLSLAWVGAEWQVVWEADTYGDNEIHEVTKEYYDERWS